jgi:hypothetical protein
MYVLFTYFWNYAQNNSAGNYGVHLVKTRHSIKPLLGLLDKMYECLIVILWTIVRTLFACCYDLPEPQTSVAPKVKEGHITGVKTEIAVRMTVVMTCTVQAFPIPMFR